MNRIKRIHNFLTEYKSKTPYLQSICKESYEHYIKELGKEYKRFHNHPHPEEYLGNDINTYITRDIRTAELW
jgi:hypothetical protein